MEGVTKRGKYYEDADLIRGFAILLVVLGHAVAKENILTSENVFCNVLYEFIYSFHMPLFFIISGFVFSTRKKFGEHVWHIVRGLLVPYVFFNLFTICLQQMLPFFSIEERSVGEQIKAMVLNGGNLWFIYVLIEFRLLFYLIDKLIDSKIDRAVITLLILIVIAMMKFPGMKYFLFGNLKKYAPFFMLGYMIKLIVDQRSIALTTKRKLSMGFVLLIIDILLFCFEKYYGKYVSVHYLIYFPLALAGCAAAYFLVSSITHMKVRKALVSFGQTSFQIYIFNGYFISVSRTLLSTIFHVDGGILVAVANFIMGLLPNYYFCSLILKLNVVKMIFGKKIQ